MSQCSECENWQPDGAEATRAECRLNGVRVFYDDWCSDFSLLMPDVTTEKLAAAISAGSESK